MASSVGSRSLLAASDDEKFDHLCDKCLSDGHRNEGKKYCIVCTEYLCDSCVVYHTKSISLKNHKIVAADTVSVDTNRRLSVYCGCNRNQEVDIYCEEHGDVICSGCKHFNHHNCKTIPIQQKCSKYSFKNFEATISNIKLLYVKYEQLKQECNINQKDLKRSKEACKKEIETFRKKLDNFLNKLEQKMLEDLEELESKENQRINEQITILTTALQMIDADYQMLDDAKTDGRKHVMFGVAIQTSKSFQVFESRLQDLEKDVKKLTISFEKNDKLIDLQSNITIFGSLLASFQESDDKQRTKTVLLGQQIGSCREVNVRQDHDVQQPGITGCVVMPNDYIVICDYRNCKLKVLDSRLVLTDSCEMFEPWDVSVLDFNNVIISNPDKEQLQQVEVFPQLRMGRVIQLDKKCWGVAGSREHLYVSCHNNNEDGEVRVLDKQGNLQRRLGVEKVGSFLFSRSTFLFAWPDYITVNSKGDKIFVSDWGNQTITCMTADGSIKYQYKDKDLRGPRCLHCDDDANILVVDRFSHTVQVITAEGKLFDTILSFKDKLDSPRSIAYRRTDNILILGCIESVHLLVYQLS